MIRTSTAIMNSTKPADRVVYDSDLGMSHDDFLQFTRDFLEGKIDEVAYDKDGYKETIALNQRRFEKWQERTPLNQDLIQVLRDKAEDWTWYLINEPWCVDGAFVQPLLQAIVDKVDGHIDLRIFLRDRHPELMDQFLTNGGRAIPKLIALNAKNEVLFTWGPRPAELQDIITDLMQNQGGDSNEKLKTGTRWYIKDKGVKIQQELLALTENVG